MKIIFKLYTLATILLFSVGVFTEANATVYKCLLGGRIVYSNVASTCDHAEENLPVTQVAVDKYPLDLGVHHEMGAAAHAFLRGMSTEIPHYSNVPDYSGTPDIVVPDLSRPEYSGYGGYSSGREFDDYGAVRPRSYR